VKKKTPQKSGPKPIYGVSMRKVLVTLDETTISEARALGKGIVALGIRRKFGRDA
jgi:hypothetical protein